MASFILLTIDSLTIKEQNILGFIKLRDMERKDYGARASSENQKHISPVLNDLNNTEVKRIRCGQSALDELSNLPKEKIQAQTCGC
jgi:hypothetical protein